MRNKLPFLLLFFVIIISAPFLFISPLSEAQTSQKPVIVIDPGHSGQDKSVTDPSGLIDHDYPNPPEDQEVFDVAQKVKTKLEADGYTVIMTKNNVNDYVSLHQRADIANNAHAALAISIHNDHGQPWSFAQIYVQKVGLHRDTASGQQIKFTDDAVAQKSQQYGQMFAQERTGAEGHNAAVTDENFDNRPGLSPGNIPLVQLFAKVPWVYNEVGASSGYDGDKYAQGLIKSIEKAVPTSGGTTNNTNNTGNGSAMIQGSFDLVLRPDPNAKDKFVTNRATAEVIGGTGGDNNNGGSNFNGQNVPASGNNCSGMYQQYMSMEPSHKNYGDPNCELVKKDPNGNTIFDKDKILAQLKQIKANEANGWFFCVIPNESNYNANAYLKASTSGKGAYGLVQMNPTGQGNGQYDNGEVNWSLQLSNGINYNDKAIGHSFNYWPQSYKSCLSKYGVTP